MLHRLSALRSNLGTARARTTIRRTPSRPSFILGPQLWPDQSIQSHAEAYYQLSKVLQHHASLDGTSITPNTYRLQSFIIGLGPGEGERPGRWHGRDVWHQHKERRTIN